MEIKKIGHYCGVVGIYNNEEKDIATDLFYSLFSLQHRGQEACGFSYRENNKTVVYKRIGMIADKLSKFIEEPIFSKIGIGHSRYSTQGENTIENAQPISVECNKGSISISHNGNISNYKKIKEELKEKGSIFQSTSDSELILHLISRSSKKTFKEALVETLEKLKGAYSIAMIHNEELIAIRDPFGFRPLYIGSDDNRYAIASETCAFDSIGIKKFREVNPGEIIFITDKGVSSVFFSDQKNEAKCIFEIIYFARPDSEVFNVSVHNSRIKMGKKLAKNDNIQADIVIPVPDSGNLAALGYSKYSGVPFELGITRNHYTGRSFILSTTSARKQAVKMKLHPIKSIIKGKRVILVDDSMVRGTTAKNLVEIVKEAGAKEIHLRLCSPKIYNPCYYGVDIPSNNNLIANNFSDEEMLKYIGADTIKFLTIKQLQECVESNRSFCFACFNGKYPT